MFHLARYCLILCLHDSDFIAQTITTNALFLVEKSEFEFCVKFVPIMWPLKTQLHNEEESGHGPTASFTRLSTLYPNMQKKFRVLVFTHQTVDNNRWLRVVTFTIPPVELTQSYSRYHSADTSAVMRLALENRRIRKTPRMINVAFWRLNLCEFHCGLTVQS